MNQPETARALLHRYGLPEDVIDGALCLHAQELAAVQRLRMDELDLTGQKARFIGRIVDLIDPTKTAAVSSAGQAPATDHTALRDRIAAALHQDQTPPPATPWADEAPLDREYFLRRADAVLAVLPAPVDRAAVLRWAADRYEAILASAAAEHSSDPRYYTGVRDVILGLRRMADETQPAETEAHEPLHQWRVEILDGDEWMPASGLRRDRSQAAEQLRMSSEKRPLWNDGSKVQRRLVRETTTYTVEQPAAGARQDGAES